jgi:hypothetical protein
MGMERNLVDDYANFADDEYANDNLAEDVYYKVCTTLASEYLKDFGDIEACLKQLAKVEPVYYLTTCITQMEEDSLYADIMLEFTYHLNRWGILAQQLHRPTQGPANA